VIYFKMGTLFSVAITEVVDVEEQDIFRSDLGSAGE
jgi:hypothetical protein